MHSNISTTSLATGLSLLKQERQHPPPLLDINTIDPTFAKDLAMPPHDMDIVLQNTQSSSYDAGDCLSPTSPLSMSSSMLFNPDFSFLDQHQSHHHSAAAVPAFPADVQTVSTKNVAQNGGQNNHSSTLVLESVSYKVIKEILQVIFSSNSQVRMSLRSQC